MHSLIDPLSSDFLADPYPFLAQQREQMPIAYCESIDMWIVTRYEDVNYVFLHPEIFSAAIAQAPLMPLCDEAMDILRQGFQLQPTMSNFEVDAFVRRSHGHPETGISTSTDDVKF